MKRSKTSKSWMQEHVNDSFVQRAKADGLRSRAAYKLLEIDDKDHLLRPGMVVADLGAAPGSWCQVAARRVGIKGRVFALDLLPVEPLEGVEFLQGDFSDDEVLANFEGKLGGQRLALVLSDIAPNMSGIPSADQARAIYLAELVLEFAREHLAPGGKMLIKVFQGAGFNEFRNQMASVFASVSVRKPKASRDRSPEVYLLGDNRRP